MRESSGVRTEADIDSGCLHQFFSLLIFFISDLPESEVAPSQNQIFGCGPIDAHHVVQEKGSF